ncbi:hypothetical protein Rsub_05244 [Raphidocelis subcapitata]|uniref:Uncharacterized protein n=1 Tax=Raphidocelis subcapitata TaxID=307507 RepID=A0A2V0P449_9CHLO|nr:hypothetical protein Rsub_05244 [Raphidocelis subcapitata]|eukprot:GBF92630.1 hypothetical protein Rsub_05244 [Raphidocelis subcapitata]
MASQERVRYRFRLEASEVEGLPAALRRVRAVVSKAEGARAGKWYASTPPVPVAGGAAALPELTFACHLTRDADKDVHLTLLGSRQPRGGRLLLTGFGHVAQARIALRPLADAAADQGRAGVAQRLAVPWPRASGVQQQVTITAVRLSRGRAGGGSVAGDGSSISGSVEGEREAPDAARRGAADTPAAASGSAAAAGGKAEPGGAASAADDAEARNTAGAAGAGGAAELARAARTGFDHGAQPPTVQQQPPAPAPAAAVAAELPSPGVPPPAPAAAPPQRQPQQARSAAAAAPGAIEGGAAGAAAQEAAGEPLAPTHSSEWVNLVRRTLDGSTSGSEGSAAARAAAVAAAVGTGQEPASRGSPAASSPSPSAGAQQPAAGTPSAGVTGGSVPGSSPRSPGSRGTVAAILGSPPRSPFATAASASDEELSYTALAYNAALRSARRAGGSEASSPAQPQRPQRADVFSPLPSGKPPPMPAPRPAAEAAAGRAASGQRAPFSSPAAPRRPWPAEEGRRESGSSEASAAAGGHLRSEISPSPSERRLPLMPHPTPIAGTVSSALPTDEQLQQRLPESLRALQEAEAEAGAQANVAAEEGGGHSFDERVTEPAAEAAAPANSAGEERRGGGLQRPALLPHQAAGEEALVGRAGGGRRQREEDEDDEAYAAAAGALPAGSLTRAADGGGIDHGPTLAPPAAAAFERRPSSATAGPAAARAAPRSVRGAVGAAAGYASSAAALGASTAASVAGAAAVAATKWLAGASGIIAQTAGATVSQLSRQRSAPKAAAPPRVPAGAAADDGSRHGPPRQDQAPPPRDAAASAEAQPTRTGGASGGALRGAVGVALWPLYAPARLFGRGAAAAPPKRASGAVDAAGGIPNGERQLPRGDGPSAGGAASAPDQEPAAHESAAPQTAGAAGTAVARSRPAPGGVVLRVLRAVAELPLWWLSLQLTVVQSGLRTGGWLVSALVWWLLLPARVLLAPAWLAWVAARRALGPGAAGAPPSRRRRGPLSPPTLAVAF